MEYKKEPFTIGGIAFSLDFPVVGPRETDTIGRVSAYDTTVSPHKGISGFVLLRLTEAFKKTGKSYGCRNAAINSSDWSTDFCRPGFPAHENKRLTPDDMRQVMRDMADKYPDRDSVVNAMDQQEQKRKNERAESDESHSFVGSLETAKSVAPDLQAVKRILERHHTPVSLELERDLQAYLEERYKQRATANYARG